jgi:hypothetical protein
VFFKPVEACLGAGHRAPRITVVINWADFQALG